MRSIRRSLTAYLLLLLTVTLGVVGVLIDQVTGRTLEARQKAALGLIDAQYANRCRDERQRVDGALLHEAQKLGNEMRKEYHSRSRKEYDRFRYLAALANADLFYHPLTRVVSAANAGAVSTRLFREYFSHLPIDEAVLNKLDEQERADYFQINSSSGRIRWRSDALGEETLDHDPRPDDEFRFDDTTVKPSGTAVRRAVLKVPLSMSYGPGAPSGPPRFRPGDRRSRPEEGEGGPTGGVRGWPRPGEGGLAAVAGGAGARHAPPFAPSGTSANQFADLVPRIYVQCARPRAALDAVLGQYHEDRDAEMETVAADVRAERDDLRGRLLAVGLMTFAAIGLGAPLLVGLGMRPLRTLSEAVSRVSERDFKLPHDGRGLPRELEAIHRRLTQTLDMLRRAFAREKQAVADISHELRTPIASLQATFDVALRKARTPDQYRATLEDCRAINRQLGLLVERIMTLASLDAGSDRTAPIRVDGADVAAACAAVIRPLAAAHGLALNVRLDGSLELDTDPDKLGEALMNVMHNAVEYNRPGGRVDLSGKRDGDRIAFEVADTGIGMTAEVRERIFERFYRADPSRQATGVHAGLGLAIVEEYVGLLGGTVRVTSVPGQGTRFRLEFPAPQEDHPSLPAPFGRTGATAAAT